MAAGGPGDRRGRGGTGVELANPPPPVHAEKTKTLIWKDARAQGSRRHRSPAPSRGRGPGVQRQLAGPGAVCTAGRPSAGKGANSHSSQQLGRT